MDISLIPLLMGVQLPIEFGEETAGFPACWMKDLYHAYADPWNFFTALRFQAAKSGRELYEDDFYKSWEKYFQPGAPSLSRSEKETITYLQDLYYKL